MTDQQKIEEEKVNFGLEIISTERHYVEKLTTLKELFIDPIEKAIGTNEEIISLSEFKLIFSDIIVLWNFHDQLLQSLKEIFKKNERDVASIARIYIINNIWMNAYSSYFGKFSNILSKLKNLRKNSKFQKFVEKSQQQKRCENLILEDFLSLPLQRITHLKVLFESLMNLKIEDKHESQILQEAFHNLDTLLQGIDKKKTEQESSLKVQEISQKITGLPKKMDLNLVEPHRRFILEGPVIERDPQKQKRKTPLYLFLFNDLLLVTKPKSQTLSKMTRYQFLQFHPLSHIKIKIDKTSYQDSFKEQNGFHQ
ncbi:faciogenital dysplasia protein [Anaeramoeba ignava]|uniref:Faciogenital dysplasia protein n=1 Tax=Anaeramoeba ignava TaxID=1746090 RepID=A0A9Q0LMP8_ANAIG|nr:faciogenital dysplasia protein [Anaeramoeba ignava]